MHFLTSLGDPNSKETGLGTNRAPIDIWYGPDRIRFRAMEHRGKKSDNHPLGRSLVHLSDLLQTKRMYSPPFGLMAVMHSII